MKKNSENKVLLTRLIREVKINYKQFIAMILIASLAFILHFGLASNYRSFNRTLNGRNGLYNKSNMSDLFLMTTFLSENDINSLTTDKNNNRLIENKDYSLRFMYQASVFSKGDLKKKPHESAINSKYNVIITKNPIYKEKLNFSPRVFDSNGKTITPEGEGIYLSKDYINYKSIGSDIKISLSIKSLLKLIGFKYDLNTGKVLFNDIEYVNEDFINKLKFLETFIEANSSKFVVKGKKNIITFDNYLQLLRDIDEDKVKIEINAKFNGFVDHPEVVQKQTNIGGNLFIDFNYLSKLVKESLNKSKEKKELFFSFANFFYNKAIDRTINPLENDSIYKIIDVGDYIKNIKKVYTQLFINELNNNINFTDEQKNIFNTNIKKLNPIIYNISNNFLYNQIIYNFNKDKEKIEYFQNKIKSYFENINKNSLIKQSLILNSTKDSLPTNIIIDNDIKQSKSITYTFPLVFFVVAILVIITTATQIILRERSNIGTLRAIGIKNYKIYMYYIAMNVMVIVIGIILGVIIGPLLIPKVMSIKYSFIYNIPNLSYYFPYQEVLVSLAVTTLLISLICYFVCRKEINAVPASSMRPKSPKIKVNIFKQRAKKGNIAIKMAFRNIKVNWIRSLLTILGVLGCSSLIVSGMGISDTIRYGINHDLSRYYNQSDIAVNYIPKNKNKVTIGNISGIKRVENFYNTSVKVYNDGKERRMILLAFPKNSYFYKPSKNEQVNDGEVLISRREADRLNLKKSDKIVFEIDGFTYDHLTIGAISDSFSLNGIVCKHEDLKDFKDKTNYAYIQVEREIPQVKYDEIVKELRNEPGVTFVLTTKQSVKIINNILSTMSIVSGTISIFALLLALIVLYNQARLNLTERTREIVALKVLGFKKREIIKSLIFEMMFLTLIGAAIGLAAGYTMLIMMLQTSKVEMINYIYYISPFSYIVGFIGTVLVTFFINLYMGHESDKIDMISNLKSVE